MCLETKEQFFRISDAAKKYNICRDKIQRACCGKQPTAGNLHWVYKNVYDRMSEEDINLTLNGAKNNRGRGCVCLNSGKHFYSLKEAGEFYGLSSSKIAMVCSNKRNIVKGFVFVYEDEYKQMTQEDITKCLNRQQKRNNTACICIETNEYFNSVKEAANTKHLSSNGILRTCHHQQEYVGGLHFLFVDEYEKLSNESVESLKQLKTSIKCACVCLNTGEIFDSISEAAKKFNLSCANISSVCRLKYPHTKRLVFRFLEDYNKMSTKEIQDILKLDIKRKMKKCFCEDLNKVYDSVKDASVELAVPLESIRDVCRGRHRSTHGYHFKYID